MNNRCLDPAEPMQQLLTGRSLVIYPKSLLESMLNFKVLAILICRLVFETYGWENSWVLLRGQEMYHVKFKLKQNIKITKKIIPVSWEGEP